MVQAVLTPDLVELVKRESKDCTEKQEPSCWVYCLGDNGVSFSGAKCRLMLLSRELSKTGVLSSSGQASFPGWSLGT